MGVTLTKEMIQGAQETEKKYGVPASVTLGQIMLESGGSYQGGLSGLAYNYNNLFGVTAGSSWNGKTIYMTNKNGSDGKTYRVYNSVQDSITDHAKVLMNGRYTTYTKDAKNVSEYVDGIAKGGYAEDSNYASKLKNIIATNNLTQYDNGKIGGIELIPTSTNKNTSDSNKNTDKTNLFGSIVVVIISIIVIGLAVLFFTKSLNIDLPKMGGII